MASLTVREREVVTLLSQGKTPAQIAELLNVTRPTVYDHIDSSRRKTRTASTLELAVKAAKEKT